jgi:hypothetical protein
MRNDAATIWALIDTETIEDFYVLIDVQLGSNHYYYTSLPHDLVFGGNTYISNGKIAEVEAPIQTNIVSSESYRIKLSDHSGFFANLFDGGVINGDFTVYLGFKTNGDLNATAAEVMTMYKGAISSVAKEFDPENGTAYAVVEGASPVADLDSVQTFITSENGMDQYSSSDTSFDKIHESGKEVKMKWGKVEE